MAVDDYSDLFDSAANKYAKEGIDPQVLSSLLRAQAAVESSGNPNAVGPATKWGNAEGLMQLIPPTAKSLGVKNPFDPQEAIPGAAYLMAENLKRYKNPEDALRAYHGGTDKKNWGKKTEDYVSKVMKNIKGANPIISDANAADVDPIEQDYEDLIKANKAASSSSKQAETAVIDLDPIEQDFADLLKDEKSPKAAGSSVNAASTPIPQKEMPAYDQLSRQVGLTGRYILEEGAAPLGNLINTGVNYGIRGTNKLMDTNIPELGMPTETISQALTSAGLPVPTTPEEKAVEPYARTAAGVLGLGGLGKGAVRVADEVGAPIAKKIGEFFAANPKTQMASALTGTGAAETAKDLGYGEGGQLAAGLIGSAAIPAGAAGLAKIGGSGVRSEIANLAKTAKNYGIDLPAAQISDSKAVKWLDATLPNIPFSGHGGELEKAKSQFTRAVSRTFGEDTSSLTREAMEDAGERIGKEFNKLAADTPAVTIGEKTRNALAAIDEEAKEVLGESEGRIAKQINKIMEVVDDDSVMSSKSMQALLRSNTPLDRLAKDKDPNIAYYARGVKDALFDALGDSAAPKSVETYNTARQQWKNYKTIEDLANKAGVTGEISPALLLGQVSKTARRFGKGGLEDLQNLSDIGQTFFKGMPQSGTAERNMIYKAMLGSGGVGSSVGALMAGNPGPAAALAATTAGTIAGAKGASKFINSQWYKNRLMQATLERRQSPLRAAIPAGAAVLNSQFSQ